MKIQNTLALLAFTAYTIEAFTVGPSSRSTRVAIQQPQTPFLTTTQLYAEESGAEATDEEDANEEAKEPASSSADDILNSPAFLSRKIDVLKSDIEAVNAKIEAENKVYEENKAEWGPQIEDLRVEYTNMQERLKQQAAGGSGTSIREVAQTILGVLDNCDRAFTAVTPSTEEEIAIEASYKDVHASILSTLSEMGVNPVETVGIEFDYEYHQAVMMRPDEDYEEGIVCEELAKGFATEDGTLIRAAMVVVAA